MYLFLSKLLEIRVGPTLLELRAKWKYNYRHGQSF